MDSLTRNQFEFKLFQHKFWLCFILKVCFDDEKFKLTFSFKYLGYQKMIKNHYSFFFILIQSAKCYAMQCNGMMLPWKWWSHVLRRSNVDLVPCWPSNIKNWEFRIENLEFRIEKEKKSFVFKNQKK